MRRYQGGTRVAGGYYWSPRRWAVELVPEGGGVLPGHGEPYRGIHWAVALLLAPVLGGLFVVFLAVSMVFVYRSFSGMRIQSHLKEEAATGSR